MLEHFMTVFARQAAKHKLFSVINLLGLSIGLAACLVLLIFVRGEMTWDRHWQAGEDLFQMTVFTRSEGRPVSHSSWSSGPLVSYIEASGATGVKGAARVYLNSPVVKKGGGETQGVASSPLIGFVDPEGLAVLRPQVIAGASPDRFDNPGDLLISRSMAARYFDGAALGQELITDSGRAFRVIGVFEDSPQKSHLAFDMLAPLLPSDLGDNGAAKISHMGFWAFLTYLRLEPGTSAQAVDDTISQSLLDFLSEEAAREGLAPIDYDPIKLINVQQMHLDGPTDGVRRPTDRETLAMFTALSLIILVIACINFMNMSVVRMASRAREVAMRKVLGAGRRSLASQFMVETICYVSLAFLLAVAMVEVSLNSIASLLGASLSLGMLGDPVLLVFAALLALVTLVLTGVYPAVFAAKLRPAASLSAGRTVPRFLLRLSQVLTVFQFVAAISMIGITLVVQGQMDHLQNLDRGYDRDNVLILGNVAMPGIRDHHAVLKQSVLDIDGVEAASFSWTRPGYAGRSVISTNVVDGKAVDPVSFTIRYIDPDYLRVLKLSLLAGRPFQAGHQADIRQETEEENQSVMGGGVIVSLLAARQMGYAQPEQALGATVQFGNNPVKVVGVVADTFVDAGSKGSEPTAYLYDPTAFQRLNIRIRPQSLEAVTMALRTLWEGLAGDAPFALEDLASRVERRYRNDERRGQLFGVFSMIAIILAAMGQFGLAAFATKRRAHEIVIRKVHGASLWSVLRLFGWQFTKPVLIASVLAWPVIHFAMAGWLESFVERIGLSLSFFILPSLMTLLIALLTVASQSLEASRQNPSQALRES